MNGPGGEKCIDCKFWMLNLQRATQGFCRRYPPPIFFAMTPKGPAYVTQFPEMAKEGWCGEFKPKVVQ